MEMNVRQERPGAAEEACGGCGGGGRRAFLIHSAGVVAAALAGLGISPQRASGMPMEWATPLRGDGNELTLPIPAQDGVTIYKERSLLLARHADAVYAFSLACPHQKAALRWLGPEGRFQCSKHKSRYRPDGVYISGRATRSMDRFPIRQDGRNVVVNLSSPIREDHDRSSWGGAVVWLNQK